MVTSVARKEGLTVRTCSSVASRARVVFVSAISMTACHHGGPSDASALGDSDDRSEITCDTASPVPASESVVFSSCDFNSSQRQLTDPVLLGVVAMPGWLSEGQVVVLAPEDVNRADLPSAWTAARSRLIVVGRALCDDDPVVSWAHMVVLDGVSHVYSQLRLFCQDATFDAVPRALVFRPGEDFDATEAGACIDERVTRSEFKGAAAAACRFDVSARDVQSGHCPVQAGTGVPPVWTATLLGGMSDISWGARIIADNRELDALLAEVSMERPALLDADADTVVMGFVDGSCEFTLSNAELKDDAGTVHVDLLGDERYATCPDFACDMHAGYLSFWSLDRRPAVVDACVRVVESCADDG